ncbi:MAG: hypothetical protein V3U76_13900 [Granulosicoccus sp.]
MLLNYNKFANEHRSVWISAVTAALWAFLLIAPTLSAQSNDLEPPLIEHDLQERGQPGETQDFSATVVDDQALAGVRLHYRYSGETDFTDITMTQIASSAVYTASLDTEVGDLRAIEYYIEARDKAGNRVVQGHPFNPMVRLMGDDDVLASNSQDVKPESSRRRRWLYIGLGVLAAGAVAAAASGDGGGGNDNDFVITLDPP